MPRRPVNEVRLIGRHFDLVRRRNLQLVRFFHPHAVAHGQRNAERVKTGAKVGTGCRNIDSDHKAFPFPLLSIIGDANTAFNLYAARFQRCSLSLSSFSVRFSTVKPASPCTGLFASSGVILPKTSAAVFSAVSLSLAGNAHECGRFRLPKPPRSSASHPPRRGTCAP